MQFRKFKQNKLWRDKVVELWEHKGSKLHWRRLSDKEFEEELKTKLMEETQEVCTAKNRSALIEELADVLEVIDSLCELHNFTLHDIAAAKQKKYEERGGFHGRKLVTLAEHADPTAIEYCLNDPEKYQEVFD